MSINEVFGQRWTRKHDDPATPIRPAATRTVFPRSLEEVIQLGAAGFSSAKATASGSHWALSDAAVADATFVETHDPNNLFQAMGKTLFDVVPGCLSADTLTWFTDRRVPPFDDQQAQENAGTYLVHFETGKRIYQLYSELDHGDDDNPQSLAVLLRDSFGNADYLGPWALATMGGAGGQTVFGALTTGTHGGDFRMPPIADFVVAMHLVADGGRHYWIEPKSHDPFKAQLTDDDRLKALYGDDRYRGSQATGAENFEIIRDDDVFNAVLIGAGRFGIVYSVVMRAVRQYSLHHQRRLTTWQAIRSQINDLSSDLYRVDPSTDPFSNRFLQIGVSLTPHDNFTKNLAGITKHWNVPLAPNPATGEPAGRAERVGPIVEAFNAGIQAPRFKYAGNSHGYSPDPAHPGAAASPSLLARACSDARFMHGLLQAVVNDLEQLIQSNGTAIGAGVAVVVASGAGGFLLPLLAALAALLPILLAIIAALESSSPPRLGQTLNELSDQLLNRSDPQERAAGVFMWQQIGYQLFSTQQNEQDFEAISYAVMDGHDYFDQSCNINVDSIEVFFDATDPMLPAFVDQLLRFEIAQETTMGRGFVGYLSIRFTGKSRALLAEHRHPTNCVVEVAGLADAEGVRPLIDYATTLALNPNFNGILHWGQRNESTRSHIERRFGDGPTNPGGDLFLWRSVLSRITDNGRLSGFSNGFTRRTALEVVTPQISEFALIGNVAAGARSFVVRWDCGHNPEATEVSLQVLTPSGGPLSFSALPLAGQQEIPVSETGSYQLDLRAQLTVAGQARGLTQPLMVNVP